MRVYHFLSKEFGLKDLRERRLKVSRLMDLNDPFEFLAANLADHDWRKASLRTKAQLAINRGLICCSKDWHNPVQWAHYADKHRGICLGFDVPESKLAQVRYVSSRLDQPTEIDEAFVEALLVTKFDHWRYEDEVRLFVSLDDPENELYFFSFSDQLSLQQVIVGAASDLTRADVSNAMGNEAAVEVFKARAAFNSFEVVRNQNESLWA
jgi:hypothetical protein